MNEHERDPRIDAAWRAASRDEPPVALDDAIRAAARRAVDSAPQRRRDKHWWYPFAAAATVAVIAVGLLQLTPPEQVTPAIVADAPKVAKQEAASAPPQSNAIGPGTPAPVDVKKKLAAADERAESARSNERAQKLQRQRDAADKLSQMPAQDSARNVAAPAETPPSASSFARRSEPFPAAAPEAARRDAAVATEAQGRLQSAPAAEPAAPPPAAASPPAAGVAGGTVTGAPLEEKPLRAKSALAKDASEAQVQAKTQPRSVEDWIKLIRELRSAGRIDEATKEIAAFRSAYGERADSLLPADLRAFGTPAAR
ncbi:MAG TPA: hypothetical protein VMM27_14170 [Casimicrobiaceae bacterium]|nr:hypothetical protein [Casimicrobiaceae bacterium]